MQFIGLGIGVCVGVGQCEHTISVVNSKARRLLFLGSNQCPFFIEMSFLEFKFCWAHIEYSNNIAVADPGVPRRLVVWGGDGAPTLGFVTKTYYLAGFLLKTA